MSAASGSRVSKSVRVASDGTTGMSGGSTSRVAWRGRTSESPSGAGKSATRSASTATGTQSPVRCV